VALQFRRGTEGQRDESTFVPLVGEPIYTTDTKRLYVGDGNTVGGNPIGYNNKLSDLSDIELQSEAQIPILNIAAAENIVTITTTVPHGLGTGDTVYISTASKPAVNGLKTINAIAATVITFNQTITSFPVTLDSGAIKYEPIDNAILAYDQATGKWGEQSFVYRFRDLGDVKITNPQENDIVQWTPIPIGTIKNSNNQTVETNVEQPATLPTGFTWTQTGTISKFKNKQFEIGIDNLTDVLINESSLANRQILAYDSFLEAWKNQDYVDEVTDLADVELTPYPDLTIQQARVTLSGSYAQNDIVKIQITGTEYQHKVTLANVNYIDSISNTNAEFDAAMLAFLATTMAGKINANANSPVNATASGPLITLNPKGAPINLNLTVNAVNANTGDGLTPGITKFEPVTKHVLTYDGQNWTNKGLEINNFSLSGLNDVDLDNVTNNQIIQYNESSGTWRNVDNFISITQFADVEIGEPAAGDALIYSPTNQKFEVRAFKLDDLSDVNDPSSTAIIPDGSVLAYSDSAQAWTPQTFNSLSSRTEITFQTGPIENLEITTKDFEAFTGYAIFKVKASAPCTITLYVSDYEREADLDRAENVNPGIGQGIFAELSPPDTSYRRIAPVIYGFNDDVPITRTAYAKIRNRSGYYQSSISITFVLLQIEADPEQAGEGG